MCVQKKILNQIPCIIWRPPPTPDAPTVRLEGAPQHDVEEDVDAVTLRWVVAWNFRSYVLFSLIIYVVFSTIIYEIL